MVESNVTSVDDQKVGGNDLYSCWSFIEKTSLKQDPNPK